jgi:hypothetical protein
MQSSDNESGQVPGGLGPVVKPEPAKSEKKEEKWVPASTPGYVKNTVTGAIKRGCD